MNGKHIDLKWTLMADWMWSMTGLDIPNLKLTGVICNSALSGWHNRKM
jgi:hypothetical protein